jgi:hypothetical protein
MPDITDDEHKKRVAARAIKMNRRAVDKYGKQAADPGGDPDRDVFDYCINELAGLPRYANMMEHRIAINLCDDHPTYKRALFITKLVREEGANLAFLLERLRHELLLRGVNLGQPENLE